MSNDSPQIDTSDMIVVHRLQAGFSGAGELVTGVSSDDARFGAVRGYLGNLVAFLKVHHEGEDELVYPLLRERCPDGRELFDRMEAEHGEVTGLLSRADEALTGWTPTNPASSAATAEAFRALCEPLDRHLAGEESDVLDLAAENLSPEEWGALPGHAMKNFGGDNLWLIVGLIRENMGETQRAEMLAKMPPPVADAWRQVGENTYTSAVAAVRSPG